MKCEPVIRGIVTVDFWGLLYAIFSQTEISGSTYIRNAENSLAWLCFYLSVLPRYVSCKLSVCVRNGQMPLSCSWERTEEVEGGAKPRSEMVRQSSCRGWCSLARSTLLAETQSCTQACAGFK